MIAFALKILLVLVSVLLVAVILLQRNKGAGAGVSFGMGEAVFGAEMGNILTRTTVILGIVFLAIVVGLSFISARASRNNINSVTDGASVAVPDVAPQAENIAPESAEPVADTNVGADETVE